MSFLKIILHGQTDIDNTLACKYDTCKGFFFIGVIRMSCTEFHLTYHEQLEKFVKEINPKYNFKNLYHIVYQLIKREEVAKKRYGIKNYKLLKKYIKNKK